MSAPDLERLLADAREEAQLLRANRAGFGVERVETLLGEIQQAAEPWLTWLSEGDAAMRAGYKVETMRARFEQMRHDGNAKQVGRFRFYRLCAVPRRANTIDAATRGREAARRASA